MTNYDNDTLNLIPGITPRIRHENLKEMFQLLKDYQAKFEHEYYILGYSKHVIEYQEIWQRTEKILNSHSNQIK